MNTNGATLFARFAYPPNELGYCGPDDHAALLAYASAGTSDPGLTQLARRFAGAWPYLELIAAQTSSGQPLDRRVVEAYWLGNDLLDRVGITGFGNSMLDRFRKRAGRRWEYLAEAIEVGARPTHSYHVFGVYPWVGLLNGERPEHPLHILDRCRIRWGRVVSVDGDSAVVASRPLEWDGRRLSLGASRPEAVTRGIGGIGLARDIVPGEIVALHWDWICDRLSPLQLENLRRSTRLQLDVTNRRVAHPAPAAILA